MLPRDPRGRAEIGAVVVLRLRGRSNGINANPLPGRRGISQRARGPALVGLEVVGGHHAHRSDAGGNERRRLIGRISDLARRDARGRGEVLGRLSA